MTQTKTKRQQLSELVRGRHLTDADIDELVAEGFDEDAVLQAMANAGHTIGRTTDGRNEWWAKYEREPGNGSEQGNL